MPAVRAPLIVEVGEPIQLRKSIGVILVHHVYLHFAESPGELHLPAGREILRRGQQTPLTQKSPIERVEKFVSAGGRPPDAPGPRPEKRGLRPDRDGRTKVLRRAPGL